MTQNKKSGRKKTKDVYEDKVTRWHDHVDGGVRVDDNFDNMDRQLTPFHPCRETV